MKIICYTMYALWAVAAIVLKILGLVSWWVATSFVWLPLGIVLSVLTFINFSVFVGRKLKESEDAKIPDSCQTCLFGVTKEYAENGKCLGETLNEGHEYGKLCSCYKRHLNR